MRFGIFVLITYILSILKKSLENEKKLARLDHLTQAANYRSFSEAIFLEIQRAQRYKHPFSLAYLDLDNFKLVNDRFGHEAGNKLLQETVALMQTETRKTDLVGRLGGDEFAILMPETDKRSARDVLVRIKNKFALEMENKNYQVSMSIGCITYLDVPLEVDDILQKADELMYSIKKRGKDNLSCEDYVFPAKKNAS
jgi:diguanylate cyclase (GGDEF)-like protein